MELPELRDAAAFAGEWHLTGGSADCRVWLFATPVEGNAHRLEDADGCLDQALGAAAGGWRPAPDGIDIAGVDAPSIGFFSFEGDAAVLSRAGVRLVLRRAALR